MTNYAEIDGAEFGRMLRGFGVNILVSDVARSCEFLSGVLHCEVLRQSDDFAILRQGQQLFQLHVDGTYAENPYLSCLPEAGFRGAGVELRLFDIDPDQAEQRARDAGFDILQTSTDKPHGLRECYLLGPDGYCWVPSRALAEED